jgi:geranylgeranyl pyrophosphate synthase
MQFQTATQAALALDSVEYLLDMVETKMVASISANSARVSRHSTSALDAATYHLHVGGQRVRAKLALQAGLAFGISKADAVTIATTVELLHNASLVHDDIHDSDKLRRGQKAVWLHFGVNTAICTGDLLLSAAYASLSKIENVQALPAMIALVHERTASAIDGQCADLIAGTDIADDHVSAVSRYQQIAIAKSGALLCLPIELTLLACGQERHLSDARHAVEAFSIGYQIVDDLNDVDTDTSADALCHVFNIMSIYKVFGGADAATGKAKELGRQHLDVAIDYAGRLPSGAGLLLIDYACRLRRLLEEQN